jgi:hypothetical protein
MSRKHDICLIVGLTVMMAAGAGASDNSDDEVGNVFRTADRAASNADASDGSDGEKWILDDPTKLAVVDGWKADVAYMVLEGHRPKKNAVGSEKRDRSQQHVDKDLGPLKFDRDGRPYYGKPLYDLTKPLVEDPPVIESEDTIAYRLKARKQSKKK